MRTQMWTLEGKSGFNKRRPDQRLNKNKNKRENRNGDLTNGDLTNKTKLVELKLNSKY